MHEKRFRFVSGVVALVFLLTVALWQLTIDSSLQYGKVDEEQPVVYKINPANYTYVYPINLLPIGDYNRLIDLEGFYFQIMNSECNDSSPLLLILVHSAPENFDKRKVIRETWGQRRDGMKLIFMLGDVDDDVLYEKLQRENEIHRDFAQGNFMDTYRNITYKHVMVLKYVIYHCPQAKYILKTDDDIFVNIEMMTYFLNEVLSPDGVSDLLLCKLLKDAKVFRSYRSKWRVSVREYPDKTYPAYCPGFALLYSPDTVFSLYIEAQRSKFFWIDDVHITGILAQKANITHTDVSQLILTLHNIDRIIRGDEYPGPYLYGPADLPGDKIRNLWYADDRHSNKKFKYYIQ